jgi:hypothetical protein
MTFQFKFIDFFFSQQLQYQHHQQQQQQQQQQNNNVIDLSNASTSSYPPSYPISRRNSSDRLIVNLNNNSNMLSAESLLINNNINQTKNNNNNSQFNMHQSNQWQSNNNNNITTTANISDQIDSVHSNSESILNKMTSNEISQPNELTLGTSSSGSSVSQNDNATLMSILNMQAIDANQFLDILIRHQKERDELNKKQYDELLQFLYSQVKFNHSNENVTMKD